jgi:nucleotide-binding universal stress UspA family protein
MSATGEGHGDGRIVVGVDGSEASKDALAWAARQARITGGRLEAVMAWHIPGFAYGPGMLAPTSYDFAPAAKTTLEETVDKVLGEGPDVAVRRVVVEGPPALRLLEAAAGADLLVVGSRGHGAFAGMLLGSVSEHCVAHASCPVVVVRHTSDPA